MAAKPLSAQQKEFARRQLFGFIKEDGTKVRMNNTTQSYLSVYSCKTPESAVASGLTLLRTPRVKAYQRKLLEDAGFNKEAFDKRAIEIALTGEAQLFAPIYREVNKIMDRIVDKNESIVKVEGIAELLADARK